MELTLARRPDGWLMAAEDGQSPLAELVPELQTSVRRLYSPVDSGGERAAPPIGLTVRLSGEGDAPPLRSSRSAAPSLSGCWRTAYLVPPVADGEASRDGDYRPQGGVGGQRLPASIQSSSLGSAWFELGSLPERAGKNWGIGGLQFKGQAAGT